MTDTTSTKRKLDAMSNEKLMDVYRNGSYYGYNDEVINHAHALLEARGIPQQKILINSTDRTTKSMEALDLKKSYVRISVAALIAYFIMLSMTFFDLLGRQSLTLLLGIYLISFLVFIVCLIGSAVRLTQFFKATNKPDYSAEIVLYVLFGFPLFFIVFIYFLQRINSLIDQR